MVVLSVPQGITGMPVTIGIVIFRHRRPEKISGRRFRDMSEGADVASLGQPTVNRDCCISGSEVEISTGADEFPYGDRFGRRRIHRTVDPYTITPSDRATEIF